MQLLKEKGLLPELGLQVDNMVCSLDPELQSAAALVASTLRGKGQSVDLVLQTKPMKWCAVIFTKYFQLPGHFVCSEEF